MIVRNIAGGVLLLLILGCVAEQSQDYASLLIGKWGSPAEDGKEFWAYEEYFPDGTVIAYGTDSSGSFEMVGNWKVRGNRVDIVFTKSSVSDTPADTPYTYTILNVDESIVTYEYEGQKHTLIRVR